MNALPCGPVATADLQLLAGTALHLGLEPGACDIPHSAIVPDEIGRIPGGRLLADRAIQADDATVYLGCVTAASDDWAPGLEALVFDQATVVMQQRLLIGGADLAVSGVSHRGATLQQSVAGAWHRPGGARTVRGAHWLGFAGPERAIVVCSVLCTEPATGSSCEPVVSRSHPLGAWMEAPEGNLLVRAVLAAGDHPAAALFAVGSIVGSLVWALLATRPRPRTRLSTAPRLWCPPAASRPSRGA